jgi:chaperonin GroEL (HSP60 family)
MTSGSEVDERFQTLINNATAARVVSQAVETTIGPKGLDTMMVDSYGDVVITNDGVTILKLMEINHPAAKMIINAAKAQQDEVGDGTTTATIIASALVSEGTNQVLKGVPVTKVIEGISLGVAGGMEEIKRQARAITGWEDPLLFQVALVAGRGDRELADLVIKAGASIGREKILESGYKLADAVIAVEGAGSEVLQGVILNKRPVNRDMPTRIQKACLLVFDDALKPDNFEEEALRTEAGFKKYLEVQETYRENLAKIIDLGVNVVLTDRNVDDLAEEILTEGGVMVVQRVSHRELERICEHTGARMIKRGAINREAQHLQRYTGRAELVEFREDLDHIRAYGGGGKATATVVVGAATSEVVEERERMARDAAAAVQAAWKEGVVPGGGAVEVWTAEYVNGLAGSVKGMTSYGVQCVKEALERPFTCIMNNAGFNPLEKLAELGTVQKEASTSGWMVDCDSGRPVEIDESGVWDPALVKLQALQAAREVASAILRITTVVKKRELPANMSNYDAI